MDSWPEMRLMSDAGNEKGGNAPGAAFHVFDLGFFDAGQAAYARADDGADAVGIFFCDFQAAVAPRLHARRHAVMDEAVHLLGFLGGHVLRDVEILDFTRDLGVESRGIETSDTPDARTPVDDIVPCAVNIAADWRNNTQTGNDDTSFHG